MVTSSDLNTIQLDLNRFAAKVESASSALETAWSSADTEFESLPAIWGGPRADDVIGAASAVLETSSGSAGNVDTIASAMRTLAREAGRISDDLQPLESDRDDPSSDTEDSDIESDIQELESDWNSAITQFNGQIDGIPSALEKVTYHEVALTPNPATDPETVAEIVEQFGGPEAIIEIATALFEEGDTEGFQELANLVGVWLQNEDVNAYDIEAEIGHLFDGRDLLNILLVVSTTAPPEILSYLIGNWNGIDNHYLNHFFAELTGNDNDHVVLQNLFERLLHRNPDLLDAVIARLNDNGFANVPNVVWPALGQATASFLASHPDQIDLLLSRAESGRSKDLQRVLDFVYHAGGGDVVLQEIINTYAAETTQGLTDPNDPAWGDWATRMGELLTRVDDTGSSASYDPGGVAWLIIDKAAGSLPGGEAIQTGIGAVRTVVGGYQEDSTYADLGSEQKQDLNDYVLAMTAIASSDPEAAAELGSLLENGDEGTDAIFAFQDQDGGNSDLHLRIQRLARQIEASRTDAGIQ